MLKSKLEQYGISQSVNDIERMIDWFEFTELVDLLTADILNSQFNPNALIAISRGGWIPTWYLSESLNVKSILSIGMRYIDSSRNNLNTYSIPEVEPSVSEVLLIEDVLATGRSMIKAKKILESQNLRVKTVSLFYVKESKIIPDYNCGIVNQWLTFPWESNTRRTTKDNMRGC